MKEEIVKIEQLQKDVTPVVKQATALVIVTPEDYSFAAEFCKTVKGAQKRVVEFFAPMVKANLEATRATNAAKAALFDPLAQAEVAIKGKQLAWNRRQEEIRLAEETRLNAIEQERARKEREKQEAAARLQREKEQAAQREADEARRKAQEATNAKDRERLQREAEARQKEATAAAAKAQAKEDAAAAVVATTVTVASTKPEVKGQSERKIWKAKVLDINKVGRQWLIINDPAIQAFARSTRGAVPQDGIEFYEDTTLASTSK